MDETASAAQLELVDPDLLVSYMHAQKSFRSKSTVYGTLSVMRGMGDYLVATVTFVVARGSTPK